MAAGGTDSAVKKESWLTPPTVGQGGRPRLEVTGAASGAGRDADLVAAVNEETPRLNPLGGFARGVIRSGLLFFTASGLRWPGGP
ncbi:hypothetical protein MMAN_47190 [Mycobacterium mantenii]|uniref:Uncharacterized protein n=1 Tax=Mycobacterium mantenii TaxID=560555 RepID=A0ABM7JYR8_MYCNT|nr:hypothetical protein MMAN_47190 [Mycobacterium mantenii]